MTPVAITQANDCLDRARAAFDFLLQSAEFPEYHENWVIILDECHTIFEKLSKGAKSNPKWQNWYSIKQDERSTDQLLQWARTARNNEKHHFEKSLEFIKGEIIINLKKGDVFTSTTYYRPRMGDLHIDQKTDYSLIPEERKQITPARAQLVPVKNLYEKDKKRYGTIYPIPEIHLNKKLPDQKPETIAFLYIRYCEKLILDSFIYSKK